MSRDSLGDRMKGQYENRARHSLPRRTYTIVRVDGKAFHSYCRGLKRPFDLGLMDDMDATARALCETMQGARLAFVQSDEISVLLTDFEQIDTEAWFDGNLAKIVSVSASVATAAFNRRRYATMIRERVNDNLRAGYSPDWALDVLVATEARTATFDSRAFTIPDPVEVANYFIWRQQDATRNSIAMAAQAVFSHKQLHGKSCDEMQEMLFQRGTNWNDYPVGCKRGRAIVQEQRVGDVVYTDKRTGEERVAANVTRREWVCVEPPVFTQDRAWLEQYIPTLSRSAPTATPAE